jgi:hypothetical protein
MDKNCVTAQASLAWELDELATQFTKIHNITVFSKLSVSRIACLSYLYLPLKNPSAKSVQNDAVKSELATEMTKLQFINTIDNCLLSIVAFPTAKAVALVQYKYTAQLCRDERNYYL